MENSTQDLAKMIALEESKDQVIEEEIKSIEVPMKALKSLSMTPLIGKTTNKPKTPNPKKVQPNMKKPYIIGVSAFACLSFFVRFVEDLVAACRLSLSRSRKN